ncbi:hypothetical protein WME97_35675 [Sorangium sp. So ce367]|uniref:hypothetical protein n=1 Tax=Sorangium sp. So ce367 TaxID=3133305 RepID=UPI003F646BE2
MSRLRRGLATLAVVSLTSAAAYAQMMIYAYSGPTTRDGGVTGTTHRTFTYVSMGRWEARTKNIWNDGLQDPEKVDYYLEYDRGPGKVCLSHEQQDPICLLDDGIYTYRAWPGSPSAEVKWWKQQGNGYWQSGRP